MKALQAGRDGTAAMVTEVWSGQVGPKLRLLPDQVGLERIRELATPAPEDRRLLVAIDERDTSCTTSPAPPRPSPPSPSWRRTSRTGCRART